MGIFSPMWIAISTYSILPTPKVDWTAENRSNALLFLPLVGIFVGAAMLLWCWICLRLNVPAALFASVSTLLPLLLSGGIHMDGFMDTMDAVASRQPAMRKLEIMKDSHAGAFAVMSCASYLLLNFGLYWTLYSEKFMLIATIGFVVSRSVCVFSTFILPSARENGFLVSMMEREKTQFGRTVMLLLSLLGMSAMIILDLFVGLIGTLTIGLILIFYCRMSKSQFGGITGDTCGFFIQLCELSLLFGLWIGGII